MTPTQAERSEATRAALLKAGRELFAERGFGGTAAEQIVRRAGVTRGALYHHFRDKADVFRAVHESLERDLVERIAAGVAGDADPLAVLIAGMDLFLDACEDPSFARISLQEAPSVLGWKEWREIDARHAMGLVTAVLAQAMDAGVIARLPIEPLSHILIGAMGEAGLLMAAGVPRREVREPLAALLDGLRAQPGR